MWKEEKALGSGGRLFPLKEYLGINKEEEEEETESKSVLPWLVVISHHMKVPFLTAVVIRKRKEWLFCSLEIIFSLLLWWIHVLVVFPYRFRASNSSSRDI